MTIDISPKLNWRREQGTCSNSGAAGAIVYMRWNPGGDNEYLAHSEVLTYAPPTPTFLGFTGRTGGAHNNHWGKNIQIGGPAVAGAASWGCDTRRSTSSTATRTTPTPRASAPSAAAVSSRRSGPTWFFGST